jgi:hypothetical protein
VNNELEKIQERSGRGLIEYYPNNCLEGRTTSETDLDWKIMRIILKFTLIKWDTRLWIVCVHI